MAQQSMFGPDPKKAGSSAPEESAGSRTALSAAGRARESDLAELAAKFAAHAGGNLSAELSADLALEVVLNEIVEQACLVTGATGAAVILERDGEMVCRASSGANAPALGARLDSESGLTAECVKTRQVQRCDDAQADPRADGEASRSLGVRSVMILPLLRRGDLAGVLEVFSPQPGAFGERDELTLEALAYRILKNLELMRDPLRFAAQKSPATPVPPISATEWRAGSGTSLKKDDDEDGVSPETVGPTPRAGIDIVTFVLGAAVLACAVLLATLVGLRLGWRRTTAVHGHTKSASGAARANRNGAARNGPGQKDDAQADLAAAKPATNSAVSSASSGARNVMSPAREKESTLRASSPAAAQSPNSFPPAGGLLVYENGKEVFRVPPGGEGGVASSTSTDGTGAPTELQRASAVEPAGILELSPEAAEGSVLHRVEPDYPEEARQQQIQGPVVLDVHIGSDGAVQEVKLVSGQPLLADAAIAAVKQWQFKPQMLKGHPTEMQTRITLNFRMHA
jgi:TonB family protein